MRFGELKPGERFVFLAQATCNPKSGAREYLKTSETRTKDPEYGSEILNAVVLDNGDLVFIRTDELVVKIS